MLDRRDLKSRRVVALAASLTLLTGGVAACSKDGPDGTVKDFLAGWRTGNLSPVGFVAADGSKISANDVLDQLHALSGDLVKQSLVLTPVGDPKTTGDISSSTVKLDWTLPGGVPWSYNSTVRLTKQNSDGWRVIWEPAIVQSELQNGDKLGVRRVSAKRAAIQDATGRPIVTPREVVTVGVSPNKITNLAQLQKDLSAAFRKINISVDMSNLADRVKNADPGAFIDLVTLRRPDYNKIRDTVRPLAGTVFRAETRDLAPTRAFARALLGTADQATREDIDNSPQTVAQGDVVGHGGLQQRYDSTLRGTSGVSVVIAREAADGTVSDTQLYSTKPVDGKPVKVTIDEKTQTAADAALATQKQPSSLVAIKISDGSVLAVANGPDGGTVNTALTGQVPPGSTFKTVSAYGLLSKKAVTATTTVACPKNATVDGHEFKNSGGEVFGNVQFHVDYAKSCNTAFVGLSPKLGADGLQQASTALGLGQQWDLGIDAFSGKVSPADSPTELAAATFGQGATAVSPISMASVAASVARGQFKQPKLVLDPAPAKPAADGPQLDPAAVGALRSMMREVVTGGTGVALKDVQGKPVSGKTGTAEFDEKTKDTHSWFIGFQGDVAFAVMVQKGGAGSEAAVPIVKNFLNALN
jgi:cell division protein FtsI/penicillin-binding protein 2